MFSVFTLKVNAQQSSADWAMFRADPSHSGVGTGNPTLNPTLLWKYTTGKFIVSSPVVVGGVVYVSSLDGNVYALSADSGAKLWSYTTNGQVLSSPAVVNDVVYIGSSDNSVYALGDSATSSNNLFIIIGVALAAVIIALVIFYFEVYKKTQKKNGH